MEKVDKSFAEYIIKITNTKSTEPKIARALLNFILVLLLPYRQSCKITSLHTCT